jgi:hypothetical protein
LNFSRFQRWTSADPLVESARDWSWVIRSAVEKLPRKARRDDAVIEENVRMAVRKVFAPARKPVVKVHINQI